MEKIERPDLKELSSKLVKDQKKVVAIITMVDDGETTSALIAGESGKIANMLIGAMIDKPEFKQLVGKAYLAATIHNMKN